MTPLFFIMSKSTINAVIKKIKREGFAPDGASLKKKRKSYVVYFQGDVKGPNGKTCLGVGREDDERYKYWRKLIDNRNNLRKYLRSLKNLEKSEIDRPQKEEPSVEWYTPPKYIDMARLVMGGIDLDPASNPTAQQWIQATAYYTEHDDGLKQPWFGKVWCNPPYGKFTRLFMERALYFYNLGEVQECIFLVNRTGANWYRNLRKHFEVIEVADRIAFLNPSGQPEKSPRYYNDFLYLGKKRDRFQRFRAPPNPSTPTIWVTLKSLPEGSFRYLLSLFGSPTNTVFFELLCDR